MYELERMRWNERAKRDIARLCARFHGPRVAARMLGLSPGDVIRYGVDDVAKAGRVAPSSRIWLWRS